MKLTYPQLIQHLKGPIAPIYLVCSDETLLLQEAVALIRESAKKTGFTERVRVPADTVSDWGKCLYSEAHSISLFAVKRILELDLRSAKLTQTNSEALQEYAKKPCADTLLLISADKLDAKKEKSLWYKSIEKTGVAIQIWPIFPEQLPQWIIQRAKESGILLSRQAAAWLAEQVEGNLLAAAQEIEKLSLLKTDGVVDETTLATMVSDHARFDIFNFVDCILTGNSQRSLRILRTLVAEGTEAPLILWAITRELRTLADIIKQNRQGITLSTLFGQFRVREKKQAGIRAFLKRHPLHACHDFLSAAAGIDRIIKGAEAGNVWNEMERFVLRMTGA